MQSAAHPSAPVERPGPPSRPPAYARPTSEYGESAHPLKLGPNEVIYGADQVPQHLYLVQRGRVRLMRPNLQGRLALVALLGPGDVFGEAFRSSVPALGEVAVGCEGAELMAVSPEELEVLCLRDPRFALEMVGRLTTNLRHERERLHGFTSRAVPARLAQTLLRLGEVQGEPCAHGGALDLRHITQEDLADLSGACRPFVSTLINQMKRSGWVGSRGRTLCLLDREALQRAAHAEA